jgi:hypothetical protein
VSDPAEQAGGSDAVEFVDGQFAVFKAGIVRTFHVGLQLMTRAIPRTRAGCTHAPKAAVTMITSVATEEKLSGHSDN